ncbi:MAG: hypothetical protein EOO05_04730 [Chitinophagaceae bacterium]|nr:MAG: hypothetical protein EOO05_04730 [Chitinophagaceae bacterium]
MLRNKLLVIVLVWASVVQAQNTNSKAFVHTGPAGNYILLETGGKQLSPEQQKLYSIERSGNGEKSFTRIAVFSPVQTYSEFQAMAGNELATDFRRFIKAKTDADVVKFFNSSHAPKDYGFYVFDINILRAMGIVYLDQMDAGKAGGYQYQVKGPGLTTTSQSPVAFKKENLPRGLVQKIYTTDSLVSIRWVFPAFNSSLPVLGRIYRQEDGKGKYFPEASKTTLNSTEKGVYAMYENETRPEQLVNYFIVPVDVFGNEGLPSDTATAISVNYKKMTGVRDIVVTDSMGGLFSKWKALPAKPYYTGIQVLRSRDARKDFVVLDSLPADATSYLDKQVLPNVTYFYKFRPLAYKLSGWDEIIATTVHGSMGSAKNPPLTPKNISVIREGRDIRIAWDLNPELDIFAYYVLRGTSGTNMEIVSPAVMDTTWLDSTAALSGRTNYVYGVLAMNNSQLKSATSNTAGISPARGEFIQAPAGITIRPSGSNVLLSWPDIGRNDAAIAGYILYRKKTGEKEFRPVVNELVRKPYYEDASTDRNVEYVYAVSAVDRFGYESARSPDAAYSTAERTVPPSVIYVRKLSSAVEVSWPKANDNRIISYSVYRKTPAEKAFVKIGTALSTEALYLDKKFVPGKLNVYAVTITTAQGESGVSPEKTIFIQ